MSPHGPTGQNVLPEPESLPSKVDKLQELFMEESRLNKERFERTDVRIATLGGAIQNVNALMPGDAIEPVTVLNDSGQYEVPKFFPRYVFEAWMLLKDATKLASLLQEYNFRVHEPMDHVASDDDTSSEDTTTLEDFVNDHRYEAWCQLLGLLHMDGSKIHHAMQVSRQRPFLVTDNPRGIKRAANHEGPEQNGRVTKLKSIHTPAPLLDRLIYYAGNTEFPERLSSSPQSKHTLLGYKNPCSPSIVYDKLRDPTESIATHPSEETSRKTASSTQRLSDYDEQEKLKVLG